MLRLMKYLKNYVKESILAPLFKMLEAGLELIVPLVITQIIDVGIANGDKPYIYKMGFALLALGIVGLISSVTAQYFAAKAAIGKSDNSNIAAVKNAVMRFIHPFLSFYPFYADLFTLKGFPLNKNQPNSLCILYSTIRQMEKEYTRCTIPLFHRTPIRASAVLGIHKNEAAPAVLR